jgi:hypothetical protein
MIVRLEGVCDHVDAERRVSVRALLSLGDAELRPRLAGDFVGE